MPPKAKNTKSTSQPPDPFLRAINLCYDADDATRIAHFRPTTKCVKLLRSLNGEEEERAFLITAPYGTGKSLTATYLLHLAENRPESSQTLLQLGKRLAQVSPELGKDAQSRRQSKTKKGVVIALHGYRPLIGESIKEAVLDSMARLKLGRATRKIREMPAGTIEDGIAILGEAKAKCLENKCDRLLIIWDEFGRHLEAIVAEGRGDSLADIQTLAEYVARSRDLPMALGVLLHQGLLHYAGNVPQTVRADWKKIEGRFSTIQYIDDSKEIYRLVAEVLQDRLPSRKIAKQKLTEMARQCKKHGFFTDFKQAELAALLAEASHMDPAALFLLPRVSARVAQNERTLFSFLKTADLPDQITVADLYDYFSPAMRSDTTVGGTHRQWLETESAISKASADSDEVKVLKSACLLGLGTSGERTRTGHEQLLFSLASFDSSVDWEAKIDGLIERKLLLHRKHNDEVSVWHGTDIDLRSRLEEERRRVEDTFDLVEFLTKESPPPIWKPVEYNSDTSVRRYLQGEYHSIRQPSGILSWGMVADQTSADCDGRVLYLIPDDTGEFKQADSIARTDLRHERIVAVIPSEVLALRQAAIEVECLGRMQLDASLTETDPLALAEIQQMSDDAREHLQKLVDRLTMPREGGPTWIYNSKKIRVENPQQLSQKLSEIMRSVYTKTPVIKNEMIVRKKPSPVIVNARKKLTLGILDRHGREEFGIAGNFPDKSMFRTVLLHTGLYRVDNGNWSYAAPKAIKDPGLRAVWQELQKFFTAPSDQPKSVTELLEKLKQPPFGVRAGLLPILFAAALRAFPSALALTRDGEYVEDVLPSEVEQLCRTPEQFKLSVIEIDESRTQYLRALHQMFTPVKDYTPTETDLIRLCFDAIGGWRAQLSPASMATRRISAKSAKFRAMITKPRNPIHTLLDGIPSIFEIPVSKPASLLEQIEVSKIELEKIGSIYAEEAAAILRQTVGTTMSEANSTAREVALHWAQHFSAGFIENLADSSFKGFLSRMRMPYDSDALLLDSLSDQLLKIKISRWGDATIADFRRELQNIVRQIEDIALKSEGIEEGGVSLMQSRMQAMYSQLVEAIGPERAAEVLSLLEADPKGVSHGNHD